MDNKAYQENIYEGYSGDYHGQKLAKVLHFLAKKYIQDNILDVGAGEGSLIMSLKNKGYKNVQGIDLAPKSDFITQGLISALPFEGESFDTIFSTEVFEHLDMEQIHEGMAEIYRVLKRKRIFIITVPYKEDFKHNEVFCPECTHQFHRYGHLQYFDKPKMKELLESFGFQVLSSKEYSFGAMAAHPLLKYLNFIYKRYSHLQALSQTLVTIARKY